MIETIVFIFGLIIGSFLNVVIDRHGTGQGLSGRSCCDVTGRVLKWYELIPVFSFIFQKGRVKGSHSKLSWQYPMVEIATGFMFVGVLAISPNSFIHGFLSTILFFVTYAVIGSLLMSIFVYDIKHKIIPDTFSYTLIVISILLLFVSFEPLSFALPTFTDIVSGPLVVLPIFLMWLVSKGKWMGFGDTKLMLPLGWIVGLSVGIVGLILSFWIGAVVSILVILISKKRLKKNMEVPFAPFLIIGTLIAFVYTIDMTSFLELMSFLVI